MDRTDQRDHLFQPSSSVTTPSWPSKANPVLTESLVGAFTKNEFKQFITFRGGSVPESFHIGRPVAFLRCPGAGRPVAFGSTIRCPKPGESRPGIGSPVAFPRFHSESRSHGTRNDRFGKLLLDAQKKRPAECIVVNSAQRVPKSQWANIGRQIAGLQGGPVALVLCALQNPDWAPFGTVFSVAVGFNFGRWVF